MGEGGSIDLAKAKAAAKESRQPETGDQKPGDVQVPVPSHKDQSNPLHSNPPASANPSVASVARYGLTFR